MTGKHLIIALFFVAMGFSSRVFSQQAAREDYIQKFRSLAIAEMKRSGIPASITLAQGCLESNNGASVLAISGNNHFGIKCKSNWTGERILHDDDAKNECFRKYSNAEQSYLDHTDFLVSSPRYAFLFQLEPTDYKAWANGLKKAGYATDPTYARRLIQIIEDFQLYVYDQTTEDNEPLAVAEEERLEIIEHQAHHKPPMVPKSIGLRKIEYRNGLRSIVVSEGDTFESITQEMGLSNWELFVYNELTKDYVLHPNEILYIEAKMKKGNGKHLTHKVEAGDTMHFIAQMYGLRLEPLLKRNHLKKGEEPTAGEVIYLRTKRPRREMK